jgi:hypothetical protein
MLSNDTLVRTVSSLDSLLVLEKQAESPRFVVVIESSDNAAAEKTARAQAEKSN